MGFRVSAMKSTAAAGGSLVRKPVIATPSLPTAIRNFYVDSDAAAAGGAGTIGDPFKYIAEFEAIKTAGDHCHLTGSAIHGNQGSDDRIGMGSASGTSANPIVYRRKSGSAQPKVKLGGGANAWNTVYLVGKTDHLFYDIEFQYETGADGSKAISVTGGSHRTRFILCKLVATSFTFLNSTDCEWWEGSVTGDNGGQSSNTGDFFNVSNSSHRFRMMKSTFDGQSGHSVGLIGNVQSGSTDVDDVEIFDCFFRNTWAGGLQCLGHTQNAKVHWNTMQGIGRADNPLSYPRGSQDGMQLACRNSTIEFNKVIDCYRGALCSSYNFGGLVQTYSGNKFRFNTIVECQSLGLYIHHGPGVDPLTDQINNVWENNLLWDNGRYSADQYYAGFFNGSYYQIWIDHYATGNGGTGEWDLAGGNFGTGNILRDNAVGCTKTPQSFLMYIGSLDAPPQNNFYYTVSNITDAIASWSGNIMLTASPFVDQASYNLRPSAGAPVIDVGYPTSGVSYLGTAPDIGVYEYGGSD